MPRFTKGDVVRLKTGKQPIDVLRVFRQPWGAEYIEYSYQGSNYPKSGASEDFTHYNNNTNERENTMTQIKLFEITQGETTQYGTKLAVNSKGQWVMEEKGTGAILTVDKSQVEEVLPYTIGVTFDGGRSYDYFAEAGSYEVGQFYIVDGYGSNGYQVAKISGVDIKSKTATKEFKPHALIAIVS